MGVRATCAPHKGSHGMPRGHSERYVRRVVTGWDSLERL